jgi:sodium-dependent dicarboxylate transporter 2/3/5
MPKVLLVDDEDRFRASLAQRLRVRGYETVDLPSGDEAVKVVRSDAQIDVIVLDRKMPGLSGEEALKWIKEFRPEAQVIMLTGHGSIESAREAGKLDAFAYLQKPCELEELVRVIEEAREATVHAKHRFEIPHVRERSLWAWLKGSHNSRPGVILLGLVLFMGVAFMPTPSRLHQLLSAAKTGQVTDSIAGYADYRKMQPGESIADYYGHKAELEQKVKDESGKSRVVKLAPEQAAFRAKVMLATLVAAALFWAVGAVPVGVTAMLVGLIMYLTGVLQPDAIAAAFAKDAVIFIFGVLALSKAIGKTGLDRRIGLLLLGPATTLRRLLFLFLPMLAVACSFVSEHALVAFIMPLFLVVYASSIHAAGVKQDKALAVMFVLAVCFAANGGGPGSPAAGGRNAVMIGILTEYGAAPSFGQWVVYGLPFVPIMALVIAGYFYVACYRRLKVKTLNVSSLLKQASEKIGPMNRSEYITAAALVLVIVLWVGMSDVLGMGGPVLLGLVLLNLLRVLKWRDVASIQWEVVALYASACALGKGLAMSGAALYMADTFVSVLPEALRQGEGLAIATSLFTGVTTNFMSDGATVAAIGPITVPMATISGTHPWMVGLSTAFASSFAHMMIIGTPNNAIAFAMAKDPVTGEQLVTLGDFFKHGFVVLLLSFAVLWGWTFFGYWRWIGF